jgi:adenosylcobinamide-GDP ribazoletransferase
MVVMALLIALMHKKMGGYTGDCCGASFLMCELSFLMAVAAFYHTL